MPKTLIVSAPSTENPFFDSFARITFICSLWHSIPLQTIFPHPQTSKLLSPAPSPCTATAAPARRHVTTVPGARRSPGRSHYLFPSFHTKASGLVRPSLSCSASVGVSWNKIFAKLGSDMKKPDATTVISEQNFREVVWPLPVEELLYVVSVVK